MFKSYVVFSKERQWEETDIEQAKSIMKREAAKFPKDNICIYGITEKDIRLLVEELQLEKA